MSDGERASKEYGGAAACELQRCAPDVLAHLF